MAFLIFDFDGTIADTLATIVRITNRIAPEYGYPPTTPERLRYYQSLSTQDMLKQAEIPLFRLPFLLRRVRREMSAEMAAVPIVPGLAATLRELVAADHRLIVMSSNSKHNIHGFLNRHDLSNIFESVQGGVGLLSKAKALKRIVKRGSLDFSQVIYVGDETRDIDASHQIGISVAAVTWGFSNREALAAQQPAFLIDHPRQLIGAAETRVNPSWVRRENRLPAGASRLPNINHAKRGGRGVNPSSSRPAVD